MSVKIGIMGVGWLGLPLALHLKNLHYTVKTTTTQPQKALLLEKEGLMPTLFNLNDFMPQKRYDFLDDLDYLLITLPPKSTSLESLSALCQYWQTHQCPTPTLLYTSSTSVYAENNAICTEETPTNPNEAVSQIEQLLINHHPETILLRLGGLAGYDRLIGKYFSGRTLSNSEAPVNLIHRDDAIAIISLLIKNKQKKEIFNAVAPQHPTRREVYQNDLQKLQLPPTTPDYQKEKYKEISPEKLIKTFNYHFIYPNPLLFSLYTQI
ncbi:MAG: hypothetical protein EAZ55_12715 [Cytophagales bacterium]|nr:MAG: hypothetical protein EAZ55_12715 [Cytophagales bacterium]